MAADVNGPPEERLYYFAELPTGEQAQPALVSVTADGSDRQVLHIYDAGVYPPATVYLDCSPDGTHLAYPSFSAETGEYQIVTVTRDGRDFRPVVSGSAFETVTWSPDGKRLAFSGAIEGARAIWVMNSDGSGLRRVTGGLAESASAVDLWPSWSPDGRHIAFVRRWLEAPQRGAGIFIVDVDNGISGAAKGRDVARRLTPERLSIAGRGGPTWSPDGTEIAFVSEQDGQQDIYIFDIESGKERRLTNDVLKEQSPTWSPNGEEVAFSYNAITVYHSYASSTLAGDLLIPDPEHRQLFVVDSRSGQTQRLTDELPTGVAFATWCPTKQ